VEEDKDEKGNLIGPVRK